MDSPATFRSSFHFVFFFFFSISLHAATPTVSYLILTDPAAFSFVNRYEEPLSKAEREKLAPGMPVEILDTNATLGDGLTPALKGRAEGAPVTIVKDKRWEQISDKLKTALKNCTPLNDTVAIVSAGVVNFQPLEGKPLKLGRDERLMRVFQHGTRIYLKKLDGKPEYGWSDLKPAKAWRIEKSAPAPVQPVVLDTFLVRDITARFASANEAYTRVFDEVSRATGGDKRPPAWEVCADGAGVRALLKGPDFYAAHFEESTRLLKQSLQKLLSGRPWRVTSEGNLIAVAPQ